MSDALSEISKVPVPHGLPEFSRRTVLHPVTRSCNSLGNTYFLVSFLHSPLDKHSLFPVSFSFVNSAAMHILRSCVGPCTQTPCPPLPVWTTPPTHTHREVTPISPPQGGRQGTSRWLRVGKGRSRVEQEWNVQIPHTATVPISLGGRQTPVWGGWGSVSSDLRTRNDSSVASKNFLAFFADSFSLRLLVFRSIKETHGAYQSDFRPNSVCSSRLLGKGGLAFVGFPKRVLTPSL